MKLFTKYNRVNISATILTFLVGSIAFYFVLQYVLIRQLDQGLRAEQQEILNHVKAHAQLPDIQNTKHQWIEITPATESIAKVRAKTVSLYNRRESEQESVRQLIFSVTVVGRVYRVTVNQSETETEELLQLIILVTIGMIGLILLLNYIINRKLVTSLLRPFYHTIGSIRDYDLAIQSPLQLARQPIDEIDLLNDSLNKMTQRIYRDYHALRSFTENASHEMQTPLAVIRSKVEALLQEAEGKEITIQQLLSIEDATQKLSRLHQSLLLLIKLENRQFVLNEAVNLTEIIRLKIGEKQEFISSQSLNFHIFCEDVTLSFHRHLAEILISNLLNNVIRYTPVGGEIDISLTSYTLSVKNTAAKGALNNDRIFQRFYKEEQSAESTGLGLSIIKEICTVGGFTITYQFLNNKHDFTIHFTS